MRNRYLETSEHNAVRETAVTFGRTSVMSEIKQ